MRPRDPFPLTAYAQAIQLICPRHLCIRYRSGGGDPATATFFSWFLLMCVLAVGALYLDRSAAANQ